MEYNLNPHGEERAEAQEFPWEILAKLNEKRLSNLGKLNEERSRIDRVIAAYINEGDSIVKLIAKLNTVKHVLDEAISISGWDDEPLAEARVIEICNDLMDVKQTTEHDLRQAVNFIELETILTEYSKAYKYKRSGLMKINDFVEGCLFNEFSDGYDIVMHYWEIANNEDEFINMVLSDRILLFTQGYAELSKLVGGDGHISRIERMLRTSTDDDGRFEPDSDAGSVKIGNENFSVLIGTGGGDGIAKVFIVKRGKKFNSDMLNFTQLVKGDFSIYSHDCGEYPARDLNGEYSIYTGFGIVAFVEN